MRGIQWIQRKHSRIQPIKQKGSNSEKTPKVNNKWQIKPYKIQGCYFQSYISSKFIEILTKLKSEVWSKSKLVKQEIKRREVEQITDVQVEHKKVEEYYVTNCPIAADWYNVSFFISMRRNLVLDQSRVLNQIGELNRMQKISANKITKVRAWIKVGRFAWNI